MRKIKRQTKIIATIGPATESKELLSQIITEGVDVLRLNMAHADHEWIRMITKRIRQVGKDIGREPAIMMDVKGPEIRTGYLHQAVSLKKNDTLDLVFVAQPSPPVSEGVWQIEVNYDKLADHIKAGDTVLLDNGLIQLCVLDSSSEKIRCQVLDDAELKSRRHVNFRSNRASIPH